MVKNLFKKYGVTELSATLDDAYASDDDAWSEVSLSAGEAIDARLVSEDIALSTTPRGRPNVDYIAGLPANKDRTEEFNFQARGVQGSPGAYWQAYVSDGLNMKSVNNAYEGLISGQWLVQVHERTPDHLLERAETYAEWVHAQILDRQKHWDDVLKAWNWGDKVYGFMLWEIVDAEDGGLKGLQPRMPNRIEKWLFSEDGREWVGAEFAYAGKKNVIIPAEDLLLYSTGVGLDLEGLSPQRAVVRWTEIKQLVTQIEVAADESHGSGYIFVTPNGPYEDKAEAEKVVEVLSRSTGRDVPIIKVGEGYGVQWLSPNGKLPDFASLRTYCDNQIAIALNSTGSLIGLGSTGTHALADVKDDAENIRRTRMFGKIVCKWLNELLIPRLINNHFGGPVAPGLYPRLSFALAYEAKDPNRYTTISTLIQSGALTWTRDDENQIREELDLAPLPAAAGGEEDEAAGPDINSPADTSDDEEFKASRCHHCQPADRWPETPAERAIRLGQWAGSDRGIILSYDPDKLTKWVMESNTLIGKAVAKVARTHRDEYVKLTAGESEYRRLSAIESFLRNKYLKAYSQAIGYELNRLAIKGSATQLRELGALKPQQGVLPLPSVPRDLDASVKKYSIKPFSGSFLDHINMQAERIATHAYNVTASYLENNAVSEAQASGHGAKKPIIPTESAYAKHAKNYTMRTFNFGREQVIERVQEEARRLGIEEERVVMEFSSVMEKGRSCEPCMENDGRRYFLGSASYERDKPPYRLHEGPADTCLCVMNAILPEQSGYEDIISELLSGGSKVDSGLGLSQAEGGGLLSDPLISLSLVALQEAPVA